MIGAICFASCQKEISDYVSGDNSGGNTNGGDSSNNIIGDWNFVSAQTQTQSTSELNVLGKDDKTVSFTNYTTENNAGTISINDSTFKASSLTYTISSTIKTYTYQNGVLFDSMNIPFNYSLPPTNSISKYKLVGADSIYFPQGLFSIGDTTMQAQPAGAKYTLSGTLLTFTQPVNIDSTEVVSGVSNHITATGAIVIKFLKK